MPFGELGTVQQQCNHTPTHCVYTFRAIIASGATRAAARTEGMVGWLDKAELSLGQTGDAVLPPTAINVYLYDEADADWLQGLFAGLSPSGAAPWEYQDSIIVAAGVDRIISVPIMGVPTFVFDGTDAHALVFKLWVRSF